MLYLYIKFINVIAQLHDYHNSMPRNHFLQEHDEYQDFPPPPQESLGSLWGLS